MPGDLEGPGGILVCCENYILYKNLFNQERKAYFPKRVGDENKAIMINTHYTHKQKVWILCNITQ